MFRFLLLSIACIAKEALSISLPQLSPCKATDSTCLSSNTNIRIPIYTRANEEHNIESSDPLFLKKVVGDLSILKFTLYNSTQTGLKDCRASNEIFDEEITKFKCDLTCPKFQINGKYEAKGLLIALPVEGSGDYTFTSGKYIINIDSEIEKVKGEDGKIHIQLKNFKLNTKPLEPVDFEFQRLFNGEKELADAVHKFAHENWKEVTELVQDPIWDAIMKKFFRNYNNYLKLVPLEDIISP